MPAIAEASPKRAVNLSINARTLEQAKALGINLSQTVDAFLATEVKRRYWERWNEDNKEAIDAYNARIAKEGLPLAKYRTFARSLGDGRED
jgi:antitoxin CcdA